MRCIFFVKVCEDSSSERIVISPNNFHVEKIEEFDPNKEYIQQINGYIYAIVENLVRKMLSQSWEIIQNATYTKDNKIIGSCFVNKIENAARLRKIDDYSEGLFLKSSIVTMGKDRGITFEKNESDYMYGNIDLPDSRLKVESKTYDIIFNLFRYSYDQINYLIEYNHLNDILPFIPPRQCVAHFETDGSISYSYE